MRFCAAGVPKSAVRFSDGRRGERSLFFECAALWDFKMAPDLHIFLGEKKPALSIPLRVAREGYSCSTRVRRVRGHVDNSVK